MPEKVNQFEPTRCLQHEQGAPQVAVAAAVSSFPMENCQDVAIDQARADRYQREEHAQLGEHRRAVKKCARCGRCEKRNREESNPCESAECSEFIGKRVHSRCALTSNGRHIGRIVRRHLRRVLIGMPVVYSCLRRVASRRLKWQRRQAGESAARAGRERILAGFRAGGCRRSIISGWLTRQ